jgi:pyruvate/2-oxoglutarate/acetoin dehydrogenase E1 component
MERTRYFAGEINAGLDEKMAEDETVILLGQDIKDPFGGCFRVTKGLSTKYPDRVINTPISESAVMGVAVGLALQGFKPVVEVMFYDFMTLCVDQLYNHAAQFHKYWEPVNVTIRTAIGKPDYGFQHTKQLDFLFEDYMKVIRPTPLDNVKQLIKDAIDLNEPVLIVEDSQFYPKRINGHSDS